MSKLCIPLQTQLWQWITSMIIWCMANTNNPIATPIASIVYPASKLNTQHGSIMHGYLSKINLTHSEPDWQTDLRKTSLRASSDIRERALQFSPLFSAVFWWYPSARTSGKSAHDDDKYVFCHFFADLDTTADKSTSLSMRHQKQNNLWSIDIYFSRLHSNKPIHKESR